MTNIPDDERWAWAHASVHGLAVNPHTLQFLRDLAADDPGVMALCNEDLARAFASILIDAREDEWLLTHYPEVSRGIGRDADGGLLPAEYRMSLMGEILIALFPAWPRIVPGSAEAESFRSEWPGVTR